MDGQWSYANLFTALVTVGGAPLHEMERGLGGETLDVKR